MKVKYIVFSFVLLCVVAMAGVAQGQTLRRVTFAPGEAADVSDSSRAAMMYDSLRLHLEEPRLHGTVGTGVGYMKGWGMDGAYSWLGADLSYRVSDRFTLGGGMTIARSFGDMGDRMPRHDERSFAPRTARGLMSVHAEGMYEVNDRLTVAAQVMYTQGNMMPFFSLDGREGYALGASAELHYRIGDKSYLSLYVDYMRSEGLPLYPYLYGFGMPYSHYAFGVYGPMDYGYGLWGY